MNFFIKKKKNLYDNYCIRTIHIGKTRMQIDNKFKETLQRYIGYRGIDIVLHLKDGNVVELDKNRIMDGEFVVGNLDAGQIRIAIQEIRKADFFAA